MDKKLLALAVSAAMMAPAAASAGVKVYGIAQAEYNVEDRDGGDSQQGIDDSAGRSRIGFKFSEKLGGGLTAFGKVEFRIDPADSNGGGTDGDGSDKGDTATGNVQNSGKRAALTGALGARDAFVGLKGSFGSITLGSHNSPYKTAGGVKWDPWTATHLQARRAGGMSGGTGIGGHNGFMRNSVYYTSPKVNGFQVKFAIAPDETNSSATDNNNDDSDNDYSLAVEYKNGPWHAIFAHNRNNSDATAGDETLTKVGLRWKSGAHTIAGQYEDIDDANRVDSGGAPGAGKGGTAYRINKGNDGDVIWLNYQFKAGNNIFTASWGETEDDDANQENEYWAAGIIHKFSKKTRIFGGYTETDSDRSADRDAWTIGIRQDF